MRRTHHIVFPQWETHHYTDRTSEKVTSNSPPGSRKAKVRQAGRQSWPKGQQNTNLQLARGGYSSFPRLREGWGQ